MRGQIKKLFLMRGYGFLTSESGKDIFFHRSEVAGVNFGDLRKGDLVDFKVKESKKGLLAIEVEKS